MNHQTKNKTSYFFPVKMMIVVAMALAVIVIATSGFKEESNPADNKKHGSVNKDSVESVQAFTKVYKVLMSPRCMNCHPSGDRPLQGDDSHIHTMNVQRGKDGEGLYALRCSNCHQPENIPGSHTPPGNPNWRLPPANMKMVFQGRNAHDLALQIMDHNRNGHKDKKQLLAHAKDGLVTTAWHMGGDRKPPPLSYTDFKAAWDTWIDKGGFAPAE